MKHLQNNFTTPEQSKRLLELGVPADSADCYLLRTFTKGDTFIVKHLHDELYSKKDKFTNILEYLPCWSVGRLIEIYELCTGYEWHNRSGDKVELLVADYQNHQHLFNFSKLEE